MGIYRAYQFVSSYRHIFISVVAACYLLWGFSFFRYYFTLYSVGDIYGEYHIAPFTDAVAVVENQPNVENIYIDCYNIEEYLLFSYPESPFELDSKRHEKGIGNFYLEINSDTPIDTHNAYIVHQGNSRFINNLIISGIPYERVSIAPYHIFYLN